MSKPRKLAFGLALVAATAGAGIGLASAQTDSPSTTSPPAVEEPSHDGHLPGGREHQNCPNKGSGGGEPDSSGSSGASSGTNATSAGFRLRRL